MLIYDIMFILEAASAAVRDDVGADVETLAFRIS